MTSKSGQMKYRFLGNTDLLVSRFSWRPCAP